MNMMKAKNRQLKDIHSLTQVQSVRQQAEPSKQGLARLLRWGQIISSHAHLYYYQVDEYKSYRYFRIIFESLKGLQISSIRRNTFIQFSCILYDQSTSSYVGQTYFTEMFELEGRPTQKLTLNCRKSMYLYTEMENAVLKAQVWALESQKSKNNFEVMVKRKFLGSFIVDISHSNQSGRIQKHLSRKQQDRFFDKDQVEENELSPIRDNNHTTVVYQVLNTHSLIYLHLFVPPNLICDQNDRIIGLKQGRISSDGEIASDQRSKLRFQVQEVRIPRAFIKSLAESVEQQIMLTNEVMGKPMNTLKQVILHMQFHNGWKSISRQAIILKDKLDQSMMLSKQVIEASMTNIKRKSKMAESTPKTYVYSCDKTKELNAVYLCQGGVLLIWMQAKMEFKFDIKVNDERRSKSQIITLPIGFTVHYLESKQDQLIQTFQLFPGNPYNLTHLIQFLTSLKEDKRKNAPSNQNKISCELMFYLIKSKEGLESIGKNTLEKDTQQIQSLRAEKERLVRMRRKIKEEKRKKLIQINQQIPFLDPTKIKEELYKQKIEKIRSEKQQKEGILFYLKAKANQLQRQILNYNYNRSNEDQSHLQSSRIQLVQKLPEYFLDYKPQENPVGLNQGLTIDIFNTAYCKKAQKMPTVIDKSLLSQFMQNKTFLNLKIVKLMPLREEIQEFTLFLYDFSGRALKLKPLTSAYEQYQNVSMSILVTQQTSELTGMVLSSLMNGFLPMYVQCGTFKKLLGLTFIELQQLIRQVQTSSICLPFIKQLVIFKQEETQLAQLELLLSFTQSLGSQQLPNLSQMQQNLSMQLTELVGGKQGNIINRINRYKEKASTGNSHKAEVIQRAFSSVTFQRVRIHYSRGINQIIKLRVVNNSNYPKTLNLKLLDSDQKHLRQPQVKVIYNPSDPRIDDILQLITFKSKNIVEVQSRCTQLLVLEYYSLRKAFNPASPFHPLNNHQNIQKSIYNHHHKITVTLTQVEHNLVHQIFQIQVLPTIEPNTLYLEAFITQNTNLILPIPCNSLEIEQTVPSLTLTPTRAIVPLQTPPNFQSTLLQIRLLKNNPQLNQKIPFQKIQLYLSNSAHHSLQCRLWQQQDILLKVPFEVILKRQIEFSYAIQSLKVQSKHIDFKIKNKQEYSYQVELGVNRKNNDILIRGKVSCNAIGKQIYPVQVSDQYGNVIYKISITNEVDFPTLTPDKIINIKIPRENLDLVEQFSYRNISEQGAIFETKSLKPQLLKIKERTFEMKSGQKTAELSLQFDWGAILEYLQAQEREQCHLLMGVVGMKVIDYYLLRCRA